MPKDTGHDTSVTHGIYRHIVVLSCDVERHTGSHI